jgi:L-threonylcarbamoyladenylate synthase
LSRLVEIDPHRPERRQLEEAVAVLKAGGVTAFPTISFYGLGADALNKDAFFRVFHIKHRPYSQPLPLFIPDASWVEILAVHIDDRAMRLMEKFWPGGLTLVFRARPDIVSHLVSPDSTIGLRVPSHPIPAGILSLLNRPLTGTSANLTGSPPCTTASCVRASLPIQPDLILDGGATAGKAPSTVLDVTSYPFRIIREGLVSKEDILAAEG